MKRFLSLPNIFTTLRIVLLLPYIILISYKDWTLDVIALIIFIIAGITDFLDGYFARLQHKESEFGKFYDPLADKILIVSVLISQLVTHPEILPFWLVLIVIIRDIIISDFRLLSMGKQKLFSTLILAKMKTVFLFISIISANLIITIENYFTANLDMDYRSYFNNIQTHLGTIISILPTIFITLAVYFSIHSGILYFVKNKSSLFPKDI